MPQFRPFRGLRYAADQAREMSDVVAPPYDVLSVAQVHQLYQKSPYNVIRLDLGIGDGDSAGGGDWHGRAGERLRAWRREGVLSQDEPAYYALRQTYRLPDGTEKKLVGLIGACRLEPFGKGSVLPHERTFSKPKEDRLKLMRATLANLSQIYAFYSDPACRVEALLEPTLAQNPDIRAVDDEGQLHEVWVIRDRAIQSDIAAALEALPAYIADGHHRYETALAFRDEMAARHGERPEAGWNYVMMFLANLDADTMTVLPTHRLLKGVPAPSVDRVKEALSPWYEAEVVHLSHGDGLERAAAEVTEASGRIACYVGGDAWLWLSPIDRDAIAQAALPDRSDAVRRLVVTALHELLLPRGWGLDKAAQQSGEYIEYLRDADRGLQAVDQGEAAALFYVPAPGPVHIRQVADAGDVMPHKSTYFYPKLLTGLVINDLQAEIGGA